ncbi:MAG: hypothetical protein HQK55_05380, partial [Deltaproteobacteria bacterium]|nr:hypothetical protein [Deltaproteobacteria bacterium]
MIIEPSYEELNQQVSELDNRMLQRRQAEDMMVWNSLFNKPMVDSLPAGFGYYSTEMHLLMHNRLYGDFLRVYSPYESAQYVGLDHYLLKPGSRRYSEGLFRHVLDSRRALTWYDFELHITRDGQDHLSFWDIHVAPVVDGTGRSR